MKEEFLFSNSVNHETKQTHKKRRAKFKITPSPAGVEGLFDIVYGACGLDGRFRELFDSIGFSVYICLLFPTNEELEFRHTHVSVFNTSVLAIIWALHIWFN